MKIAVCADLQFDTYARWSQIDAKTGLTTRLLDVEKCFRWIIRKAEDLGCQGLLILGDLFNSRTQVDVSVLYVVGRCFWEASNHCEPDGLHRQGAWLRDALLIPGNHDSYLHRASVNSLRPLEGGWAQVLDEPCCWPLKSSDEYDPDTVCGFVPWCKTEDEFRAGVEKVRKEGAKYLFAHQLLKGAIRVDKGFEWADWAGDFKKVLLGDVHEPIRLGTNIQYVGAPMQFNYGDAGGKRGFWILTLHGNLVNLEFVENTFSPRFHVLGGGAKVSRESIDDRDFVRIKTDDPVEAARIRSKLKGVQWVESEAPDLEEAEPRIAVRTQDTHEQVLQRYVDFQQGDAEILVPLGLEILEAAKVQ